MLGGVLVVCGRCYNLGKIDRSVVVVLSPPLPLKTPTSKLTYNNTRNELTRPVMGTIF